MPVALLRIYLDANFFIAAIEGQGTVSELCWKLLQLGTSGDAQLLTSELTLAEVLVGPLKLRAEPAPQGLTSAEEPSPRAQTWLRAGTIAADYGDILDGAHGVRVIGVDRTVLVLAAHWRAGSTPPKLPDAIHLATAEQENCTYVVSGDGGLRANARYQFERIALEQGRIGNLIKRIEE